MHIDPKIEASWKEKLFDEFKKPYFANLKNFLLNEKSKYPIYPSFSKLFNAFDKTPLDKLKVVILGQDPYHGDNQAHGLCFSVPKNITFPPSLKNIFKEYCDDLNLEMPKNGDLSAWALEGVFLLNTVLSVRANSAYSHRNQGWEIFTDAIIKCINKYKKNVVFILWGKQAHMKSSLINTNNHFIISSAHPSPLSSYRGFFGSRPFSKTNNYLNKHGKKMINWELS